MNADLGKKPELDWLPIGKLSVDAKYQRDTGSVRSKHLIQKIAENFQWSRFGVVMAVKHEGGWFIIDGQHRVEAARARGDIRKIPALILPHATVEAAAADFVAINRDRVAVTPLHIHHAQLAAGDPEALALQRACAGAGVEICRYPVPANKMKPRQTLAVASIARLVRLRSEAFATEVLKRVLKDFGAAPGTVNARSIRFTAESIGMSAATSAQKPQSKTPGAKARNCLRCGKPFVSEGSHNRMCTPCKASL